MQPVGAPLLVYLAYIQDHLAPSGLKSCGQANTSPSLSLRPTANTDDYRHDRAHGK